MSVTRFKVPLALSALTLLLVACAGAGGKDETPDTPDAVVEAAANAFAIGFTERDLSDFESYFAPANLRYGDPETIDAARAYLDAASPDSHIEIDSFDIKGSRKGASDTEAVVSYEAVLLITPGGGLSSEITVSQDVSLQSIDGRWLIVGADTAHVVGDIPSFDG